MVGSTDDPGRMTSLSSCQLSGTSTNHHQFLSFLSLICLILLGNLQCTLVSLTKSEVRWEKKNAPHCLCRSRLRRSRNCSRRGRWLLELYLFRLRHLSEGFTWFYSVRCLDIYIYMYIDRYRYAMPEFFNFRKPKIYYKFWSSLHQLHNLVTYSHMILTCSISLILISFVIPSRPPRSRPERWLGGGATWRVKTSHATLRGKWCNGSRMTIFRYLQAGEIREILWSILDTN